MRSSMAVRSERAGLANTPPSLIPTPGAFSSSLRVRSARDRPCLADCLPEFPSGGKIVATPFATFVCTLLVSFVYKTRPSLTMFVPLHKTHGRTHAHTHMHTSYAHAHARTSTRTAGLYTPAPGDAVSGFRRGARKYRSLTARKRFKCTRRVVSTRAQPVVTKVLAG